MSLRGIGSLRPASQHYSSSGGSSVGGGGGGGGGGPTPRVLPVATSSSGSIGGGAGQLYTGILGARRGHQGIAPRPLAVSGSGGDGSAAPSAHAPPVPSLNPTGNPRHGRLGYGLDLAALLANLEAHDPVPPKQQTTPPAGSVGGGGGPPPPPLGGQHANTARKMPRRGSAGIGGPSSARGLPAPAPSGATPSLQQQQQQQMPHPPSFFSSNHTGPSLAGRAQQQQQQLGSARLRDSAGLNRLLAAAAAPQQRQPQPRPPPTQEEPLQQQEKQGATTADVPRAAPRGAVMPPNDCAVPNLSRPTQPSRSSSGRTSAEDAKALDGTLGCLTPVQALERFEPLMSRFEHREISEYPDVYFLGCAATKIEAPVPNAPNYGFDDERGDYIVTMRDHIAYRYEVLSELGKGSFGQVLKVRDYKRDSLCALKIIRNKKRFHQQAAVEIRILDHLRTRDPDDRSCTVRMLSYFKFRSHTVITFEMHSMNLYELTKLNKYQPFAPALIKRFTAQILVALSFMWREQIVHCDLKPENLLLRYENKTALKVIDFGSSCFETERVYTYIQSRFYRAPEIILGMSYGRPIDTWSIGCIICEMQIGYPIFPGENEKEQLACIMEVLGLPPARMIERSPRRKDFFDGNGVPKLFANSRNKVRKPATKDIFRALRTDDASFVDFVLSFLQWEPADRITPTEAMRHPWVAECFQLETGGGGGATTSSAPGGGGVGATPPQPQPQPQSSRYQRPVAAAAAAAAAVASSSVHHTPQPPVSGGGGGAVTARRLGSASVRAQPLGAGALPSIGEAGSGGGGGGGGARRHASAARRKGGAGVASGAGTLHRFGGTLSNVGELSL